MLELAFTVGLPLSGKSTWIDREMQDWQVVCPDDIRSAFGHEFFGPIEPVVWGMAETMVRSYMIRKRNTIIDATNVTKGERFKWVKIAREYHARPVAYLVDTHWATCIERAKSDDRHHMVPVIIRMKDKAKAIEYDEGAEIRRVELDA